MVSSHLFFNRMSLEVDAPHPINLTVRKDLVAPQSSLKFDKTSGAIGEFYSAVICPEARQTIAAMQIDAHLDERREVSVEEYERIERIRTSYIEQPDFIPDFSLLDNWYDEHYKNRQLLVLKEVKGFCRRYEWS